MSAAVQTVTYIVRSFPRLSQTFIVDEIRALERLGARVEIFAITDPEEPLMQSDVRHLRAPVRYLDEAARSRSARLRAHATTALHSPSRYLRAVLEAIASRKADRGYHVASTWSCLHYAVALTAALRRLDRDTGRSRRHLHAHFAHDPALVALLAHHLTSIPFTFTAHARDIVQVPVLALSPRIRRAEAVVTCCMANVEYLSTIDRIGTTPIVVVHNGLDLRSFPPVDRVPSRPKLGDVVPPMILSVGRLVEKKGFDDLLTACAELARRGRSFRVRIVGDGPLREHLEVTAERLGLTGVVAFTGAMTRGGIVDAYRDASVFALTPFVTDDGDRDGLPTVLAEAMASCLPVVTTAVAGIPELVAHGINGLVAPPRSILDIAGHLDAILGDAALADRLGNAARDTVEREFDSRVSASRLATLFGLTPAPSASIHAMPSEARWVRSG